MPIFVCTASFSWVPSFPHLYIKNILINLVLLHNRMYAPNTSACKLPKLHIIWNGKKLFFSPLRTREKQSFKMYLDLLVWACVDSSGDQAAIQAVVTVNPQSWQWPPRKDAMSFLLVLLLGIRQSILVNTTQKEMKRHLFSSVPPLFFLFSKHMTESVCRMAACC